MLRPGGLAVLADFLPHANETLHTRYGDRWLGFALDDLRDWLGRAGLRMLESTAHEVNLRLTLVVLTARREASA